MDTCSVSYILSPTGRPIDPIDLPVPFDGQ